MVSDALKYNINTTDRITISFSWYFNDRDHLYSLIKSFSLALPQVVYLLCKMSSFLFYFILVSNEKKRETKKYLHWNELNWIDDRLLIVKWCDINLVFSLRRVCTMNLIYTQQKLSKRKQNKTKKCIAYVELRLIRLYS